MARYEFQVHGTVHAKNAAEARRKVEARLAEIRGDRPDSGSLAIYVEQVRRHD